MSKQIGSWNIKENREEKERKNKNTIINSHNRKIDVNQTWEFFVKQGTMDSNILRENKTDKWIDTWKDEPCFVIGTGVPLKNVINTYGWNIFDGRHTIGINHVIEDYDNLEVQFFLDKRFLDVTTYDMSKFKGEIVAQKTTLLKSSDNVTLFHCNATRPGRNFDEGLYSSNLSGLAALNFALLTGANPIYLIGYGNGQKESSFESYHYKEDYTGELKTDEKFKKFLRVLKYFKTFAPYRDRIIHVTDGNDIPVFDKCSIKDFKNKIACHERIETSQIPKIAHFSFSNDLNRHAAITRGVVTKCYGNHIMVSQDTKEIPKADLYILEHFQSTDKFVNTFPYANKSVDVVHTVNAIPKQPFKKVVALTAAWKKELESNRVNNIKVINIGLDLKPYERTRPDYAKKVFGRITRWSFGKIHPDWNKIVSEILEEEKDSKCLFYTQLDHVDQREILKHNRMIYDNGCQINMFKGFFLKNLSIYVHANNTFIDIFPHGILEALATGLPIILLDDRTGSTKEVLGDAGIVLQNFAEVKPTIIKLLRDKNLRIEYGNKSIARAKEFTQERMIKEWDTLIKESLRK